MKIHAVTMCNFRGVAHRRIEFVDSGVTVVHGANELGKSSIIEAVNLLLDELDSSSKKGVRAVRPVHVDEGPEVEVEISTGPYRFVYRKRWHKDAFTRLQVLEPSAESVSGRPAHDRVRQMLSETLDRGLWEALRVQQSSSVEQAALGGNDSLARALDVASGGVRETARESDLYAEIEQAQLQFFTRGGKPTGRYRDAQSELAEAIAGAEARAAVRDVEREVERYADLAGEVESLDVDLIRQGRAVDELTTNLAELADQERLVAGLSAEFAVATKDFDVAKAADDRRSAEVKRVEELNSDLEGHLSDRDRGRASHEVARALVDGTRAALEQARRGLAVADANLRRATGDVGHLRNRADLDDLRDRHKRAVEALQLVEQAETSLVAYTIDDDTAAEINQAQLEVIRAQAVRDAAAPTLDFEALGHTEVVVQGTQRVLTQGASETNRITEPFEIVVPGALRLVVRPGFGAHDPNEKAREAEERLQELCARVNVRSSRDALELNHRRKETEHALGNARETLAQVLQNRTVEELALSITRLEARVCAYERDRCVEPPLPANLDAAMSVEDIAETDLARARDAAEFAEVRHAEHEEAVARLREADIVRDTQIKACVEALEFGRRQLAEARADAHDVELADRAAACAEQMADIQRRLAVEQTRLAERDPGQLRLDLDNARNVRRRATNDRDQRRIELTRLQGRLESAGSEGRQDRLNEAETRLAAATSLHDRTQARAEAARMLHDVFTRHRAEAKRSYIAPFQERLEQLGRIVFGNDLRLEVDEELRIVKRTLDGVTVPYEELSTGAREQLCIIERLACAMLVDPDDGVPVVLDDALGHSDQRRLDRLGAVFTAAVTRSQIIVFTSVPERYRGIGTAHTVRLSDTDLDPVQHSAPIRTSTHRAAADSGRSLPAVSLAILECLLDAGRPMGRSAVIAATGIHPDLWTQAIRTLVDDGWVTQQGERRGATYVAVAANEIGSIDD
jgi:hypothetical protein